MGLASNSTHELFDEIGLYKKGKYGMTLDVKKWEAIATRIDGLVFNNRFNIGTTNRYKLITIGTPPRTSTTNGSIKFQVVKNLSPPSIPQNFIAD